MRAVEISHADEADGLREVARVMRATGCRLRGTPTGEGLIRYATKLCLRARELDELGGTSSPVVRHVPARRHLACVQEVV